MCVSIQDGCDRSWTTAVHTCRRKNRKNILILYKQLNMINIRMLQYPQ